MNAGVLRPLHALLEGMIVEPPVEECRAIHRAIDAASIPLAEFIDTALEAGMGDRDALAFAQTAAVLAVQTYAAQLQANALRDGLAGIAAAIRETAPELAGAVSEAGTDIGSGLLAALSTLAPGGEPATA